MRFEPLEGTTFGARVTDLELKSLDAAAFAELYCGWLQYGLDGRYLWVADDGDIVSAATNRVAAYVPALANSRYLFELDWRGATRICPPRCACAATPTGHPCA